MALSTLLQNMITDIDNQVEHYENLVSNFNFNTDQTNNDQRAQFYELASYVDRLNEVKARQTKLMALEALDNLSVLYSGQKHFFSTTLNNKEFNESTLTDYYQSSFNQ